MSLPDIPKDFGEPKPIPADDIDPDEFHSLYEWEE